MVAHDSQRLLARLRSERVGAVRERVEVESSGHERSDEERDPCGDRRGQRTFELLGGDADERTDTGADHGIEGRAVRDVASFERDEPTDGSARQERDRRERTPQR